jgi:hypothetical protein
MKAPCRYSTGRVSGAGRSRRNSAVHNLSVADEKPERATQVLPKAASRIFMFPRSGLLRGA